MVAIVLTLGERLDIEREADEKNKDCKDGWLVAKCSFASLENNPILATVTKRLNVRVVNIVSRRRLLQRHEQRPESRWRDRVLKWSPSKKRMTPFYV